MSCFPLEYKGERYRTLKEAAECLDINESTLRSRLRRAKWDFAKAVEQPLRQDVPKNKSYEHQGQKFDSVWKVTEHFGWPYNLSVRLLRKYTIAEIIEYDLIPERKFRRKLKDRTKKREI